MDHLSDQEERDSKRKLIRLKNLFTSAKHPVQDDAYSESPPPSAPPPLYDDVLTQYRQQAEAEISTLHQNSVTELDALRQTRLTEIESEVQNQLDQGYKSGYEKGYTEVLAANAGANMIYECAGMHASLLGCCLESMVIDNDMIAGVMRTIRGIEVTEDSVSVEPIRQVCEEGPGHFLGHDQTMQLMETDYVYPDVGDRTSPKEWVERGSTDVVQRAKDKVADILTNHHPQYIDPTVDAKIRDTFDIKLLRERM